MATEDIRNALPPTTGYEEALLKESADGALRNRERHQR